MSTCNGKILKCPEELKSPSSVSYSSMGSEYHTGHAVDDCGKGTSKERQQDRGGHRRSRPSSVESRSGIENVSKRKGTLGIEKGKVESEANSTPKKSVEVVNPRGFTPDGKPKSGNDIIDPELTAVVEQISESW